MKVRWQRRCSQISCRERHKRIGRAGEKFRISYNYWQHQPHCGCPPRPVLVQEPCISVTIPNEQYFQYACQQYFIFCHLIAKITNTAFTCCHLLSKPHTPISAISCYHIQLHAITFCHMLSHSATEYHLLSCFYLPYMLPPPVITCYHMLSCDIESYHMLLAITLYLLPYVILIITSC